MLGGRDPQARYGRRTAKRCTTVLVDDLTVIAALGIIPALLLLGRRVQRRRHGGGARQVVAVAVAGIVALAFLGRASIAIIRGLPSLSITH